jgi:hypothetical protein
VLMNLLAAEALLTAAPTARRVEPTLDAAAVAEILGKSKRWVQLNAHKAPLKRAVVPFTGRSLRFSQQAIAGLIEREAGTQPFTLGLRGVNSGRRPQRARHRAGQAGPPSTLSSVPGRPRGGDTPA